MEDLPVEIMQKIFLELCSPQTMFPLRTDEPRLSVTYVCSRWRAIALSTPTLWATFNIHPAWDDPVPYASICTWISRAAQSTLSFKFYDPYPRFNISITSSIVMKFVFPVIHRCSFLHLYLDIETMHRLLMLPPNSLRALQSLAIVIRGKTPGPVVDPTPFSTAFGPCSQLRTFELTVPAYLEQPPMSLKILNFNAPWHQLATLTLNSPLIPAHECLDIIFRCTSLQQCTIGRLPPIDHLARDRIMGLSHPPITLPSLHTLRTGFGWGFEDNHRAFFRALRLPHLRKFQPNDYSRPLSWSSLPVFQPVLGDTIQELDLSGFTFPESLPETLALVPNLEILWLGDDTHEHPRTMIRALGDGAVAPRLATLYLDFVDSPQFLLDILEARAVAARANCDIAALSVMIFLRGSTSANPSDEARMRALAEVGMRIHLDVTNSRVRYLS